MTAGKLDIKLTKESKALIGRLSKIGRFSLIAVFKQINVSYRKEIVAIFARMQPRGAGLRWAPLNTAYAQWKERNYPGQTILRRTNELFASMVDDQDPYNITRISEKSATFGSKVPYGIYHDSTEDQGRSRPPMRNFSIPGEASLKGMLNTLNSSIVQQFAINGFKVDKVFV